MPEGEFYARIKEVLSPVLSEEKKYKIIKFYNSEILKENNMPYFLIFDIFGI